MKRWQTSESITVGLFLALSGGFMDAYSYINRGKVFANAETGNIILMTLKICEGKFLESVNYLIPITSFAIGVAISEIIKRRKEKINMIHWRQIPLLLEIVAFIVVAFLPQDMNKIANSIISLVSGVQFSTFPKIRDVVIATTMCTGNLKSGTQNLYRGIILIFIVGTALGYFAVGLFNEKAILIAAVMLTMIFLMMFKEFEN